MTPEELDAARGVEAYRLWESAESRVGETTRAVIAARLARENWTPPEPVVDPDVLAYRKWAAKRGETDAFRKEVFAGKWDRSDNALSFLAGARMAREQEQERAKELVEYVEYVQDLTTLGSDDSISAISWGARATLSKYRGEV